MLLPGAGLNSCSMLRLSGPKSCQLFTFHMVNKSPAQKTAPCTCTSFTMKPVASYLNTGYSIQAQQKGESCNSRTYPSILTRPASATMRSYSSALVASVAACTLCGTEGPTHLRGFLCCGNSRQPQCKGSMITEPPVERALSKASWGADATGRDVTCLRMLRVVVSSAVD